MLVSEYKIYLIDLLKILYWIEYLKLFIKLTRRWMDNRDGYLSNIYHFLEEKTSNESNPFTVNRNSIKF